MWVSWAKVICGTPKPRNAPAGVLFVYTKWESIRQLGILYGPFAVEAAFQATRGPLSA